MTGPSAAPVTPAGPTTAARPRAPSSSAFEVGDLLAPLTQRERVARLDEQGLADEIGLDWVLDRAEELLHDQPSVAEDLADLSAVVATDRGLIAVNARILYLRARLKAERGDLEEALRLIEGARRGWQEAGQQLRGLRTYLGTMGVLDDLGRHEDSAAVGLALLSALDDLGSDDDPGLSRLLRATAHNNLGVAYSFLGDHERSLEAYARAEAAYLDLGMPHERAQTLGNIGIELLALGRAREALAALRAAMDAFAVGGDRLWAAKCAGNVAQAHQQLGELVEAIRVLEPACSTLDELGAEPEAARIQLAIAGVHLAAGLFSEAAAEANAAAERTRAAGMVHDTAFSRFTVALAHLGAANPDAAVEELREASSLFERVGDRQYQARAVLAEAEIADLRGHRSQARALVEEAAVAMEDGGWLAPLTWATLRLADLSDDEARASRHLATAGDLVEQLGLPQLRFAYDLRLARRLRGHGRVDEAEKLLRDAVEIVDHGGADLPDFALRTAFRADRLAAHDELIDLLVTRGAPGDPPEACRVSDRAKAQTLVDLIAGTVGARRRNDTARDGGPTAHLEQRLVDLSATYATLAAAEEPDRRAALRLRALTLEHEISVLRMRLAVANEVPAARKARSGAPGLEELSDHPTLAYHVIADDVIAFVARAGEIETRRLAAIMPEVGLQLDRLIAQWNRFKMGSAFTGRNRAPMLATTRDVLGRLHDLLLAPLDDLLGLDGRFPLTVVAHRRLHQVPFHALYKGSSPLVEIAPFKLAPTIPLAGAAAPVELEQQRPLVLAVPDAHTPGVETEARAIEAVMPDARVEIGERATSDLLRRRKPGPGIIHLACHGLFRPANPLFSALRLADRWVTSAEVLDLDLGGALVVLSACESGRPAQDAAEPVGLAWAFLGAGASGVIVSQWVVDDVATAELMSILYQELASGRAPEAALRYAQLEIASRAPHPYYWAPFVYVASPSPRPRRIRRGRGS